MNKKTRNTIEVVLWIIWLIVSMCIVLRGFECDKMKKALNEDEQTYIEKIFTLQDEAAEKQKEVDKLNSEIDSLKVLKTNLENPISENVHEGCDHEFVTTSEYNFFLGRYKVISKCIKCGKKL